jgi:TMEM175 potassium channel family protein
MTESAETKGVLMDKNRMESLTDGIFAFAMTLLVTSMILPGGVAANQSSGTTLLSLLPEFYHYIIAFFVLAAFWMAHHGQLSRIHHIDHNFLNINIIGLFFVTLVPFSTSFIGDYNADVVATCLFEFNLMILGLTFALQWLYASRKHRLVSPDMTATEIRQRLNHGLIIPFISLVGIIITVMGFESSTMIYMTAPLVSYVVRHTKKGTADKTD